MYDILIVGAGTAGMSCAITATQNGAKVGIVEKADHIGGAMHWSGGHMSAAGNRHQQSKGIEDSVEKHYQDIQRITGGTGNLDLIRLAVEEAPKTLDWLDDLGFEFAPECPRIIYGHVPYDTARTQYGVDKAMSIYKVLKPLWDEQIANGNIECFLEQPLIRLEKEGNRFTTVITQTENGEQIYKGKHIVMTTGGYGSNPSFFAEKHPNTPLVSSAYPTATGDGHSIVEELGGDFKYADFHLPSLGGVELEPGRANFNEAWAMVITSVYREPREIYLNTDAQRFMDEGEVNADTREREVLKQKDWKFWLVFDEAALMERTAEGAENPIMIGWDTPRMKAEAQKEKFMWAADSIHQLAKKTGLPYPALLDSINEFNRAVALGKDEQFGRAYLKNKISQGPFYAILVHASLLVTFGGIKANKDLQLLDKNGNVLKGLYGAGELLGLGATSGNAFCSGMAITPAISFGRILGNKLSD